MCMYIEYRIITASQETADSLWLTFFSRVDSCSDCQVTTCRVCVHTDHSVDLPKECVKEVCKNLRCVVQWSRCAYEKIQSYEVGYF